MVGYGIVRPNTGWQLFSGKGVKRSSLSKKRVRKFVLAVLDPMPTVEAGEFNMKTWEIWLFRLINPKCGQLPKRLTFGRFRMLSNFWRLLSSVVFCSPGKNLTKYISCQGRGNITVTNQNCRIFEIRFAAPKKPTALPAYFLSIDFIVRGSHQRYCCTIRSLQTFRLLWILFKPGSLWLFTNPWLLDILGLPGLPWLTNKS